MIIFRNLNTSATNADVIAKLKAFLEEITEATWSVSYASNLYTCTSSDGEICGVSSFVCGYGASNDRPRYAYYDSDNQVLIISNLSTDTSGGANAYQNGICGFIHNGFTAGHNYNVAYRFNGAWRSCGRPNINLKVMLCPLVYAPYSGTSYTDDVVMLRMPNVYVSNNYYHVAPNTEVMDESGTVYVNIAWGLFVKKEILEVENG